jgi:hypothetical protein
MSPTTTLPIVLRPGLGRKILIFLGSLLFGAMAALIISTVPGKPLDLWLLALVLLGCLFAGLSVAGLLATFRGQLRLDAEGFAVHGPFKTRSYLWREVDGDFFPHHVATGQGPNIATVAWNRVPGAQPVSAWRKMNRSVGEEGISAMYGGLNVEQLAALLNRIRDDQAIATGKMR